MKLKAALALLRPVFPWYSALSFFLASRVPMPLGAYCASERFLFNTARCIIGAATSSSSRPLEPAEKPPSTLHLNLDLKAVISFASGIL
jgi:hypothetical protein